MKLEDQADLLSPVCTQVTHAGEIVPGHDHGARRRRVDGGQEVEQCGLTATRRPGDGDHFPIGNAEIDAGQGRDLARIVAGRARDLNGCVGRHITHS